MTTAGFPHSDTLGSPFGCQLPEAYRRLPRPSSAPDAKASTMRPYPLDHHTTTHHTPRQNRRKRRRRAAPSREPQKTKGIYSTNITTKMLASTVQFSNNNRIPPPDGQHQTPPPTRAPLRNDSRTTRSNSRCADHGTTQSNQQTPHPAEAAPGGRPGPSGPNSAPGDHPHQHPHVPDHSRRRRPDPRRRRYRSY